MVLLDYEKLLDYKFLPQNEYYNEEYKISFSVEDLIEYIGAEDEIIQREWNGTENITAVEIEKFKIFSEIKCTLSPNINILIGKNGLGKTSFLQALTLGLLPLNNVDKSNEFDNFIQLNNNKSNIIIYWGEIKKHLIVYKNALRQDKYINFPQKLILSYGVNLNTDEKLDHYKIINQLIEGNAIPYSTKSIFKDYSTDFFDPLLILERLFIEKKGKESKKIEKIISLIKTTLNNYLNLFSESERISLQGEFADYYFLDFNNNRLRTQNLSEGYKDFILQVTDIVVKTIAARNNIFENKNILINENLFNEVKGIIIIDEFDRHLHPELQRKFFLQLRKDFQNIQFILSTHNIFSLQSAEGYTALILQNDNNQLSINTETIPVGLSVESIYKKYFGIKSNYNIETQRKLDLFRKYLNDIHENKINENAPDFISTCKQLLDENMSESVHNVVNRELTQLERVTNKVVSL